MCSKGAKVLKRYWNKDCASFYWGLTKLWIDEYNIKTTLENFLLISETLHDLRNAF